ncbi:PLP-dependent aminotransferase family protein [Streptomyces sp. NPDC049906]|uniref:aminotransferase-like domain-containing protein n=1 Tax=Streptomyces sp. NPDC049906 TaxID=3155656 RepID=UPI003449F751
MKPIDASLLVFQLGRWSAGRGPLHLLLARRLRELIDAGDLPPGTRLPPERELAHRLAVGRATLVAAYEPLRLEGLLQRRQGSGTWVAPSALADTGARSPGTVGTAHPMFLNFLEPPDGVIQLACAAPDAPPVELLDAYRVGLARLAEPAPDLGYHPAGHPALRTALARHYTERGTATEPEQILVTTGAQQALALLVRLLVAPGDRVLVEAPTYPGALELLREAAAVVDWVPSGPTGLDAEAWCRAVAEHRPALAYLVPTCHNPTGTVVPSLVRRRLVEAARRHEVPLVDDEVLGSLAFDTTAPPGLAAFDTDAPVITVGSLSKVAWGGLRVGWIRAGAPLVSRLARLKAPQDFGSNVLSQLGAAELLHDLDGLARRRAGQLRRRHDHLCAALARRLPDWDFRPVEGGQTLWVRLPDGDASAFAQTALRHGVAVLPGASLHPAGGDADRLRLPFLLAEEELDEAVSRLAAAWRRYQKDEPGQVVMNGLAV